MRRAALVVTASLVACSSLIACGLLSNVDDDALSRNFGIADAGAGVDAPVPVDGAEAPASQPEASTNGFCPTACRLLPKKTGAVYALAASAKGVVWVGANGAHFLPLATRADQLLAEAPSGITGGAATSYGGIISWGFSTPTPGPISTCEADGSCGAPIRTPSRFRSLQRLEANKSGLYAWTGDESHTTALLSIDAAVPFDAPLEAGTPTHFVTSDTRAYWRVTDSNERTCLLAGCQQLQQKNSATPFAGLPAGGYVTIDGAGQGTVRFCAAEFSDTGCNKDPAVVPFDAIDFAQAAITVSGTDTVYLGSTQSGVVGRIRRGSGFEKLAEVPGRRISAVATNGAVLFFAVALDDGTELYAIDIAP